MHRSLIAKVSELAKFPSSEEEQRIISGLRWVGLFDSKAPVEARGNLLDTLCATLEKKMAYEKGEKDMVMLQHRFGVTNVRHRCHPFVEQRLNVGCDYRRTAAR